MGDICANRRLNVIESRDFKSISDLILHDDISTGLLSQNADKTLLKNESEERLDNERILYYLMKIDDENAGFCLFLNLSHGDPNDINEGCYLADIGILKKFRGKLGFELAKIALNKFLNEIKPERLFGIIKIENKKSLYFAMQIGFKLINKDDVHYFLEVNNGKCN